MDTSDPAYLALEAMYGGFTACGGERATELPFIFRCLPPPPARVLDVGCCFSIFALFLHRAGYNVLGIDTLPYKYEEVPSLVLDARDLSSLEPDFDAVTCVSTIEHIGLIHPTYATTDFSPQSDLTALREMASKVAPHGRLLLTFPVGGGDRIWAGHKDWIRFYTPERVQLMQDILQQMEFDWRAEFTVVEGASWRGSTPEEAFTTYSKYDAETSKHPRANCQVEAIRRV